MQLEGKAISVALRRSTARSTHCIIRPTLRSFTAPLEESAAFIIRHVRLLNPAARLVRLVWTTHSSPAVYTSIASLLHLHPLDNRGHGLCALAADQVGRRVQLKKPVRGGASGGKAESASKPSGIKAARAASSSSPDQGIVVYLSGQHPNVSLVHDVSRHLSAPAAPCASLPRVRRCPVCAAAPCAPLRVAHAARAFVHGQRCVCGMCCAPT